MKKVLLTGLAAIVAVAACTTGAIVHDGRVGMQSDELRNHVPLGSSEQEAMAIVQALADDPPDNTKIRPSRPETVEQIDCNPRPCSLVDRGVAVGLRELFVHVEIAGHLIPTFCNEGYFAYFIFDDQGKFREFITENARTCL